MTASVRFLLGCAWAALALLGCAASPTEPVATARLCGIRADTNPLIAVPDTLREVVLGCILTPRTP